MVGFSERSNLSSNQSHVSQFFPGGRFFLCNGPGSRLVGWLVDFDGWLVGSRLVGWLILIGWLVGSRLVDFDWLVLGWLPERSDLSSNQSHVIPGYSFCFVVVLGSRLVGCMLG